jgi:hypothetical protein
LKLMSSCLDAWGASLSYLPDDSPANTAE